MFFIGLLFVILCNEKLVDDAGQLQWFFLEVFWEDRKWKCLWDSGKSNLTPSLSSDPGPPYDAPLILLTPDISVQKVALEFDFGGKK